MARAKKAPKRAKSKKPAPKRAKGVSAAAVGRHLDLSRQRVGQLLAEGAFSRSEGDRFDLDACRLAYIRYLRDENRRGSKAAGVSRAQDARAREIERRMARDDNQLLDVADVLALNTEIVGAFVSELRGVPAASTRDLATRATVEEVLNGAMGRCRERFAKLSDDLRRGRGIIFDAEEADA